MIQCEMLFSAINTRKHYPLVSMMDEHGLLIYLSDNHKSIIGYDPGELVGKTLCPFIHPNDEAYLTESFRKMVLTKKPNETKSEFRHKNGNYIIIRTYSIPVFDDGVYKGCVMYSMERKNINMDLFRRSGHILSEIKYAI